MPDGSERSEPTGRGVAKGFEVLVGSILLSIGLTTTGIWNHVVALQFLGGLLIIIVLVAIFSGVINRITSGHWGP